MRGEIPNTDGTIYFYATLLFCYFYACHKSNMIAFHTKVKSPVTNYPSTDIFIKLCTPITNIQTESRTKYPKNNTVKKIPKSNPSYKIRQLFKDKFSDTARIRNDSINSFRLSSIIWHIYDRDKVSLGYLTMSVSKLL